MKLRENLSTLDQAPLSALYSLSTEIFETPSLCQFWETLTPLEEGGSELCHYLPCHERLDEKPHLHSKKFKEKVPSKILIKSIVNCIIFFPVLYVLSKTVFYKISVTVDAALIRRKCVLDGRF